MTLETVRDLLGWCTVFNTVLLLIGAVFMATGIGHKLSLNISKLPVEEIRSINYKFLATYKLLILV